MSNNYYTKLHHSYSKSQNIRIFMVLIDYITPLLHQIASNGVKHSIIITSHHPLSLERGGVGVKNNVVKNNEVLTNE